nr:MAG TPA: hypothetical protein [Caudoviricetes sp.]
MGFVLQRRRITMQTNKMIQKGGIRRRAVAKTYCKQKSN